MFLMKSRMNTWRVSVLWTNYDHMRKLYFRSLKQKFCCFSPWLDSHSHFDFFQKLLKGIVDNWKKINKSALKHATTHCWRHPSIAFEAVGSLTSYVAEARFADKESATWSRRGSFSAARCQDISLERRDFKQVKVSPRLPPREWMLNGGWLLTEP